MALPVVGLKEPVYVKLIPPDKLIWIYPPEDGKGLVILNHPFLNKKLWPITLEYEKRNDWRVPIEDVDW